MKYKFNFDDRLKNNYYSTNYFLKTIDIVKNTNNVVSMQFIHFSNEDIVVCGIDETIQLLKFVLGENFSKLEVLAQEDGNIISSNSPLLVIKGEYKYFGQLENIIDGILARRCSIATNVYKIKQKINSNQDIIFMADRNDSYFQQPYDAYPAHLLGVKLFVTNAQVEFFKEDKEVKETFREERNAPAPARSDYADGDEFYKIPLLDLCESEMGRTLSSRDYQLLADWQQRYDDPLIRYAITEAVLYGKYSLDYVDRILHNWAQKGLTAEQYENGER